MTAPRRILVTGASGFVGRAVLEALEPGAWEVHAVSRRPRDTDGPVHWHAADLLDGDACAAVAARAAPDVVVHLAWEATPPGFWNDPVNVRWEAAGRALGEAAVAAGARRLVGAGTCAEYDWSAPSPLREHGSPLRPQSPYARAKDGLRRAWMGLDADVAWARLFWLYGPGEHPERLVASVARAVLAGREASTSGATQRRDFLHVGDAGAALAALAAGEVTGPVNVGAGEAVAVGDLAALVAAEAGAPHLLHVGGSAGRPEAPEVLADVSRLRREVGAPPPRPLVQGVRESVAFWRAAGH